MASFDANNLAIAAKKIFDDGEDGYGSACRFVNNDVANLLLDVFLKHGEELLESGNGGFPNPVGVGELCKKFAESCRGREEKSIALEAARIAAND